MRFLKGPGCVLKLGSDGTAAQQSDGSYPLSSLEGVRAEYLTPALATFRQVFLYRAEDRSLGSGRGLLAFFVVDGSNRDGVKRCARAYVWFSRGQRKTRQPDFKAPLQQIFRSFCVDNEVEVKFTASYTHDMAGAAALCSEKVGAYQRERRGPTVAVGMGCADQRAWRRLIAPLNEMPLVVMKAQDRDEHFPALLWQNFVSARMMQRFLYYPAFFEDRLACARYVQAPIGNLGNDVQMTMTDITFARMLHKVRATAPHSPSTHPYIYYPLSTSSSPHPPPLLIPLLPCAGTSRTVGQ
jgi:hypothetical protein